MLLIPLDLLLVDPHEARHVLKMEGEVEGVGVEAVLALFFSLSFVFFLCYF